MVELFLGVALVGIVTYLANLNPAPKRETRNPVQALLGTLASVNVLLALLVLLATITPPDESSEFATDIALAVGLSYSLFALACGIVSFAIIYRHDVRDFIKAHIVRHAPQFPGYNPKSLVHTTAIVIALVYVNYSFGGFILSGGIAGLSDSLQSTSAGEQLRFQALSFFIYVLIALLGVGLFIRRDISQVIDRLGLRDVSWRSLLIGAGVGFFIFWLQLGMSMVWALVTDPEVLELQSAASETIFAIFSGSIWAALLLIVTTGIGEELLFRGALQPIFGNLLTSILFALLHTQYGLTPATLIIFLVSLGFGWVRVRYNTGAAMTAHMVYNAVPFVLYALAEVAV